jgi:acetolactate synthase small subunit
MQRICEVVLVLNYFQDHIVQEEILLLDSEKEGTTQSFKAVEQLIKQYASHPRILGF